MILEEPQRTDEIFASEKSELRTAALASRSAARSKICFVERCAKSVRNKAGYIAKGAKAFSTTNRPFAYQNAAHSHSNT